MQLSKKITVTSPNLRFLCSACIPGGSNGAIHKRLGLGPIRKSWHICQRNGTMIPENMDRRRQKTTKGEIVRVDQGGSTNAHPNTWPQKGTWDKHHLMYLPRLCQDGLLKKKSDCKPDWLWNTSGKVWHAPQIKQSQNKHECTSKLTVPTCKNKTDCAHHMFVWFGTQVVAKRVRDPPWSTHCHEPNPCTGQDREVLGRGEACPHHKR